MLSYWLPTPVSYWWPLVLAIVFGLAAIVAVYATLARRAEQRDASTISLLYVLGFGLVAVSEFMMYLDTAFGWSLATAWALSVGTVDFIAITAAVVAVVAIVVAAVMQFQEQHSYRLSHPIH